MPSTRYSDIKPRRLARHNFSHHARIRQEDVYRRSIQYCMNMNFMYLMEPAINNNRYLGVIREEWNLEVN